MAVKSTDLEPGVWHEVSADRIKAWRGNLPKGSTREVVIQGNRKLASPDLVDGDAATVSAPSRRSWVEPREAIDIHTRDILASLMHTKSVSESAFLARIQSLKQLVPELAAVPDEELAKNVRSLAEKIGVAVTEPVYQKKGLNPIDMDRVPAGKFTGAVLLPGQGA